MVKYIVIFKDGSRKYLEAKVLRYEERGVIFEGRNYKQRDFVAFVPYEDMRMIMANTEQD